MPAENVSLASVRRNIVLSGQVTSVLKMDAALQLANAKKISATTICVQTGHVPQLSKPKEVIKTIVDAAKSIQN